MRPWKDSLTKKSSTTEMVVRDDGPNLKTLVNVRYREVGLLSDYFPIILKNEIQVPGVVAHCSRCSKPILKAMLHGELRVAPEGCYRVTAIGWCLECDVLSPYLFHIAPFGPTFVILPMNNRGWPEIYDCKVVPFAKPEKKKKKKSEPVANTA